MKDIIKIIIAFWPITLFAIFFISVLFCWIYFLKWVPDANFCKKYFPDVVTYECVFSDKYKYDND